MANAQVNAVHGMQSEKDKVAIHKMHMAAACQNKIVDG